MGVQAASPDHVVRQKSGTYRFLARSGRTPCELDCSCSYASSKLQLRQPQLRKDGAERR